MTNHEQSAGIIDRDRKLKHSNLSNAECLPMAFGHRHATFNRDVNSLYDMISGVTPKLKSYECVGQPQNFSIEVLSSALMTWHWRPRFVLPRRMK